MKVVPFGECSKESIEISRKFGLIECISGFWKLTNKNKKLFDSDSYYKYLRGEIEKPIRHTDMKFKREDTISSLLKL
jgi:hypothetical protein